MKKSLPIPITIIIVVCVVGLMGFVGFKVMTGPPEFVAPKMSKQIPRYIYNGMSPAQQQKMQQDGYTVGDATPPAQPVPAH